MNAPTTVGGSTLAALVLAALIIWLLWDLFVAAVDLLALGTGLWWPVAALFFVVATLYAMDRAQRSRERGY